ncbi:MAG: glycolate oxidase iron-sulfur subunit [Gammaproteobacteria bacterium]|jgi:glycolate oxidase iron-sulfur subunit|nr:glycolate oxidase iron-sulfur subunit [Gammaproteobacteria bacterium]
METKLADWIQETPAGRAADEILRKCVHCGFCLATCPTYQILGDELDGPRGRIYQIKQVLEGSPATRETQLHLDRCLTCRSCETTCPSGVQYGHLVDIGRAVVASQVERPWRERALRWLLREGLTRPWLFGTGLKLARSVSWALPAALRAKVGVNRPAGPVPSQTHARKVLLLNNCVQPSMAPSIDAATARVLDAAGVQSIIAPGSGCCGAIRQHLDDHAGARNLFRRNIDAWWPFVESAQVEAILINASGCGAMVKDYAHLLRDDPVYAPKALRIVEMTRDASEFLPEAIAAAGLSAPPRAQRISFHPPCTLQHGLKIRGKVEALLTSLGAVLVPVRDSHLCCGSAGTYSILQTELSADLRTRKLAALHEKSPQIILSANIGCIAHLQGGTGTPVRHWIEWVDETLAMGCRK